MRDMEEDAVRLLRQIDHIPETRGIDKILAIKACLERIHRLAYNAGLMQGRIDEFNDSVPVTSFRAGYRFLSNFYPAEVLLDGTAYPTVEHAFQAAKSDNPLHRSSVLYCRTPADAKRVGQAVILRPDWEAVKIEVMRQLLVQKFADPGLRDALRATGRATLIEGNDWGDRFWGECPLGTGANHLGKLLMAIRDDLHAMAVRPEGS